MDVKTLSATIGHVSSATTLDIYSHITDTMQRQAAVHIDRKIGGTDAQMPTMEREERKPPRSNSRRTSRKYANRGRAVSP